MRAFTLESFEDHPRVRDIPRPEPSQDEILVRVRTSGVNGFDVALANRMTKGMMEHQFPVILGRELAGVVESAGSNVTRFAPGHEVIGAIGAWPVVRDGAWAEYVVIDESGGIAPKPTSLDFERAGVLPWTGMTALQAIEALGLEKGDRLLVVGATGGVGSFAVQLAARQGATVIATARPGPEEELVRELGAAETIDYSAGSVAEAARERYPEIQALLDLVNPAEGFSELAHLVVPGGRAATTMNAADVEKLAATDVTATNIMVAPDGGRLGRLAELAGAGSLHVPVQRVYPLEQAGDAIEAFQKGTRGKLAITVSEG